MMVLKKASHSWWFDSHNSPRRSPWLQSTLSELDEKTKAMLKLVEEDADSFAQRAEMYYKKRPELVNMVEDFYRAHRSLAERYDQLKSETGTRLTIPLGSTFSIKTQCHKLKTLSDKSSETSSYCFDSEESEVDDPEEEETQVDGDMGEEESTADSGDEEKMKLREELERQKQENGIQVDREMKLREEIKRLEGENKILKEELMEKDEKKREVIRQLGLAVLILKEDNACLKKCIKGSKKLNLLELHKWKGIFSGKLFSGYAKVQPSIVAL